MNTGAITVIGKGDPIRWAYGVTTVMERKNTLLPRTLKSLEAAGFPNPRLFIDGIEDTEEWALYLRDFPDIETTIRNPRVGVYGNWWLALMELYIRQPNYERYAIFQDDFVTYKNLRRYLDSIPYPEKGYWNLYTFPHNEKLAPANGKKGFYPSDQLGKSAVGLVFDSLAVRHLLAHNHMVQRPMDAVRGTKLVDGAVVQSLCFDKEVGYTEYIHTPTLTQHTGELSTIGNSPAGWKAVSFMGEDFDAMSLLS